MRGDHSAEIEQRLIDLERRIEGHRTAIWLAEHEREEARCELRRILQADGEVAALSFIPVRLLLDGGTVHWRENINPAMWTASRGISDNIPSKQSDKPKCAPAPRTRGAKHQDEVCKRTTSHGSDQQHDAHHPQSRAQIVQPVACQFHKKNTTHKRNHCPDHEQFEASPSQIVIDTVDL
jgi:hypothetical protein